MDLAVNPNGSVLAIEGITSPDGRVLGKMGHTERAGAGLYKNAFGNTYQQMCIRDGANREKMQAEKKAAKEAEKAQKTE